MEINLQQVLATSGEEALYVIFEQACNNLNTGTGDLRKSAEKVLMQFMGMPSMIIISRHFLEKSANTTVQFQALITLRELMMRQWPNIDDKEKENVKNFLLNFLLAREVNYAVENETMHCVASLCKRAWLENDAEKQKAFRNGTIEQMASILQKNPQVEELAHYVNSNNQMDINIQFKTKRIAILFLTSMVDEFTFRSKGFYGLTFEFHHDTMVSFQQNELKKIFSLGYSFLVQNIQGFAKNLQNQNVEKLLYDTVNLIVQILRWRFVDEEEKYSFENYKAWQETNEESTSSQKVPENWSDVLLDSELVEHFFFLLEVTRSSQKTSTIIEKLVLQGITHLASITGPIFDSNDSKQSIFTAKLLNGVIKLMKSIRGSVDMNGASQILLRITNNHRLSSMVAVPEVTGVFLGDFAEFSLQVMKYVQHTLITSDFRREEAEETMDIVLKCWVNLLSGKVCLFLDFDKKDTQSLTKKMTDYVQELTSKIFIMYVDTRLRLCHVEMDDDEGDEDEENFDDQLSNIAFIGRMSPKSSLYELNSRIKLKTLQYAHLIQFGELPSQEFSLPMIHEELHWILMIAGHTVADGSIGETPEMPEGLKVLSEQFGATPAEDPVTLFFGSVFELIDKETTYLASKGIDKMSPRVAKTIAWYLERWCRSYLMPLKSTVSENIYESFGVQKGLPILFSIIRKVHVNLFAWTGQEGVLIESVRILLSIAQMMNPPMFLIGLSSFTELLQFGTSQNDKLTSLPGVVQRMLMQGLVTVGDNIARKEDTVTGATKRKLYYDQLVNPLFQRYFSLIQQPNFVKICQDGRIVQRILQILESCRGIARSVISDEGIIFNSFISFFKTLPALIEVYKNENTIVVSVLKFLRDFTEIQTETMDEPQSLALYETILTVFKKYSELNRKTEISKKKNLDEEEVSDAYRDISTILKLLSSLSAQATIHQEVQTVVYFGFMTVETLVTEDLLEFPKLSLAFYTLLNVLFVDCPRQMSTIPFDIFQRLMKKIQFGISNYESEISRRSLEALCALFRFNYDSFITHNVWGLASHLTSDPNLIVNWIQFLLQYILFGNMSSDLTDPASDALLSLICSDLNTFVRVVNGIIEQQSDPNIKQRLTAAFGELVKNEFTATMDKKNLVKFRRNVQSFLVNVKSFLLTK